MLIIYGTRLYGRVDAVPGLFFVATRFFHIFWIPLVPLGSHVVLEETDDGFRGVPCGLNGRSVLAAYVRGLGIGGGIAAVLLGVFAYFRSASGGAGASPGGLFGFGAAAVVVGLLACGLWREPSQERFEEVCARLQIDARQLYATEEQTPEPAGTPPARPPEFGPPLSRHAPDAMPSSC